MILAVLLIFGAGLCLVQEHSKETMPEKEDEDRTEHWEAGENEKKTASQESVTKKPVEVEREIVTVLSVKANRVSDNEIRIQWPKDHSGRIRTYLVQRCDASGSSTGSEWKTIATVAADEPKNTSKKYRWTDCLETSEPKQYLYRVVPQVYDEELYEAGYSDPALCSNLYLCIDPGHYAGKNAVTGEDSYGYAEGDFTLRLALELRRELKENYGISSCMTRDSGDITLDGYSNERLDSGHVSLRGSYAGDQGCDLFLSIHTNANEDHANGVGTFQQPVKINKPIVIANDVALSSETVRSACNEIGKNLVKASGRMGISSQERFVPLKDAHAMEWSVAYNDSVDQEGTVVCRHGNHGQYYGVLRGAQEVSVPGIIIEHGFHTVPEMRNAAMNGDLASVWAEADAAGIAAGYGFQKRKE